MSKQAQQETRRRLPRAFLFVTAAVCGALVMVIEVLGSRVIGPFYGVNLFVWTSLIAVALVSLAVGYAVGGVLADRRGGAGTLYGIILAAGVTVLFVPLVKAPVLIACQPLGLRLGTLASATLLFGPSLVLLGCVSPFIVKIATADFDQLGRTVGAFYAVSTVGSFIGTAATGFLLIAWLGISQIFQFVGATLIALSLAYFVYYRRRWVALCFVAVAVLAGGSWQQQPTRVVRASGTVATQVHHRDSFYGAIKVVDYTLGDMHTRELMIDGYVQGGIDMRTGLSIYPYTYVVPYLSRALVPEGRRALVVGLGAGIMPRWLEEKGVAVDVVDIDRHIVAAARDWFGFSASGGVYIEDARYFLRRTRERYDYIMLDVFSGESTPAHVLSLEAFQLARDRMTDGGVLAANVMGCLGEGHVVVPSIVRTLERVFDRVRIHPVNHPDSSDGCANAIILAYDGADRVPDLSVVAAEPIHPMAANTRSVLAHSYDLPADAPAFIITDDYNPLDLLDLSFRERLRRGVLADLNWEFLL